MDQLLRVIAWVIETFAQIGAGLASSGAGYQPKVPTELEYDNMDRYCSAHKFDKKIWIL